MAQSGIEIGLRCDRGMTLQHALGLDIFDGLRGGRKASESGSRRGGREARGGRLGFEKSMGGSGLSRLRGS